MFETPAELERLVEVERVTAQAVVWKARELGHTFRWHPLGFVVCTLNSWGPIKVRLHIWPRGENRGQDTTCQIHDHIFDLTSWVLLGLIENTNFEPSDTGKTYSRYRAEYIGDASILLKTLDTCTLAASDPQTYPAGSRYEILAGQLHESRRLDDSPAVTILVTRDVSKTAPSVFGPLGGPDRIEYVRTILTSAELDDAIEGI